MRLFFVLKLTAVACISVIATGQAFACQCGMKPYGKTRWEVSKLEATGSTVIFEGTPERFEFQWSLLNAKEGELVSAEDFGVRSDAGPRMVVTFRVQRTYKGNLGPEVRLKTGLGGGDCGAVYAPGLSYLVFASGPAASDFEVSMCSPGGWIGSSTVDSELRYVRRRRPIGSDLVPSRRLTPETYAAQEGQRRRDFEEFQKSYAAVTGKLCGTVFTEKTRDGHAGFVSFLSASGYSPVDHPTTTLNPDGSFCSTQLGPGKYYLYFERSSDHGLTSAVYYPGVSERSKAATIEVSAGQTQSNVSFKIPVQKTFSVRGIISADDKTEIDGGEVSLIDVDGGRFPVWYSQAVDFHSRFPLPKVKYFDFENVLPGRYIVYISAYGQGWYTRKKEVLVTTHMKFISLQLIHKK